MSEAVLHKVVPCSVAEFEAFLRGAPEKPYHELVYGRIVEKSMPTDVHAFLVNRLCFWLTAWARERGLGEPGPERRFAFPGDAQDSPQPDVSMILDAAVPLVWQGPVRRVPDLVAEVQSPGESRQALREKGRFYAQSGVALTLLLLPREGLIELWRAEIAVESLGPGDVIRDEVLLPGFALPVNELYAQQRGEKSQTS